MKNAAQHAKRFTALLRKLPPSPLPEFPDADDPVGVLVMSFLLADSTTEKAIAAYTKLQDVTVDYNDLRVSMPREVAAYLGARYPQGLERCQRLRAVLKSIYLREHDVTLDGLKAAGKRDVKKYIETLDGITPFVSARVLLMAFDSHAIPVDESLRERLVVEGVADDTSDAAEVSTWLSRQVKASDGVTTHLALQAWTEKTPLKTKPKTRKKTTSKAAATSTKTTKKKSTAKTSKTTTKPSAKSSTKTTTKKTKKTAAKKKSKKKTTSRKTART